VSSLEPFRRPGKIVCVGRNYEEHAREMGNAVPESPLFFLKPPSAVIGDGDTILLPSLSSRVEHEGEIGVIIGRNVHKVNEEEARTAIAGITCVNDVTARDLQLTDSQWTRAKGFDTFCPAGPGFLPVNGSFELETLEVICRVNGEERQRGSADQMHFSIPYLISYISQIMTLEEGDLLSTGTPAGVGPLRDGDTVEVEIPQAGVLRNPVRTG
jgi:2-keto-4-pentenoate hydratase/2-oxohepta-3-ene-1,7-dioic acid hydratase in catechol pathway